jgi:hypothetical protein
MAESAAGSTGRIFISYRRDDTAYPAGWLYDRLASQYGGEKVFKDVDSIDLGDDFVQAITSAVGSCDVLLALIGKQWLTLTDERGQRRLDDPDDFVRLEIEAALTRTVLVIPILTDGARMPRVDELPDSLAGLGRRQALELNPNRFEYDTNRLLKVLDAAVADVRSADDGATAPRPVERSLHESTSSQQGADADLSRRGHEVGPVRRSRTLRRALMIGVPLAAALAIYVIIQFALNQSNAPRDGGAQPTATGQFTEEAPWRLVIRNDGSSTACTIMLLNRDTQETWSNRYPVYDTASFLIPQGGTFRWSIEPGCTVVSRPGPGSLGLPAVVDGVGTSDAFAPPPAIMVSLKDFHANYRCRLELRDVATGTVVDIGELTAQQEKVTLRPQGRSLVYLVNDACAVQVSAG